MPKLVAIVLIEPYRSLMTSTTRLAGVELGGTKAIALLWEGGEVLDRLTVPTTSPTETLTRLRTRLDQWYAGQSFTGLGIATFGPVRLDRAAPDHGTILATPKPGWAGAPVLAILHDGLPCPVAIDTDVNAAALAEYRWGAGQCCASLVYLTIGTGLGGGVLVDGRPVHGRLHPEIGHIPTRRAPGDAFTGSCPFHRDCIEGLVSGPALERRFGALPADVPADDPRWAPVAHDLAHLLATLIHSFAPQRILLGGGVSLGAPHLLGLAIALIPDILSGYYPDVDLAALTAMIMPPGLGENAGPMGAIALAQLASPSP